MRIPRKGFQSVDIANNQVCVHPNYSRIYAIGIDEITLHIIFHFVAAFIWIDADPEYRANFLRWDLSNGW